MTALILAHPILFLLAGLVVLGGLFSLLTAIFEAINNARLIYPKNLWGGGKPNK